MAAPGIELYIPLEEFEGEHHMTMDTMVSGTSEWDVVMNTKKEKKEKKKKFVRTAAGVVWEDPTLADWEGG